MSSGEEIPKQHKACVYDSPGKNSIKIEMVDTPEPGPGEVLVKLFVLPPPEEEQIVLSIDRCTTP